MKKILIFCLCILAVSCYKDEEIEGQFSDEFYVRNGKADMPTWVRGNTDSDVFIIFLHGGPLLSGIEVAISNDFERLHEDYAFVYYDQRGGGFSHGNRKENLNIDQLAEDLDAIVEFIKFQYGQDKSIFLMGHSWGGYVGTTYLADEVHQQKIRGWIELAGAHNFELQWQVSRTFVLDFAREKVSNNDDGNGFWQEAIDDLQDLTSIDTYDELLRVNWRAQRIDGEVNSSSNFTYPSYFEWAISPAGIGKDQKDRLDLEQDVINGNLNPIMNEITLPSLLIYGGRDAIVPKDLGFNALDFLGTPEEDLKLVILEESSHEMWLLQMDEFVMEITSFVEEYR